MRTKPLLTPSAVGFIPIARQIIADWADHHWEKQVRQQI